MKLFFLSSFLFLQKNVASPIFCNNYVISTFSVEKKYRIVSVPYSCTNATNGCVCVYANNKQLYKFQANRIVGCIFVATTDSSIIFKIPIGIGLSPVVKLEDSVDKPGQYVVLYKNGICADSIKIPALYPTLKNKSYFFSGNKLDRSKLLYVKQDTIGIVTSKGLVLLTNKLAKLTYAQYSVLHEFNLVKVNSKNICFPYPQPSNCDNIPRIKSYIF